MVVFFGAVDPTADALVVHVPPGRPPRCRAPQAGTWKATRRRVPRQGPATGGCSAPPLPLKGEDTLVWRGPATPGPCGNSNGVIELPPADGRRDGSGSPAPMVVAGIGSARVFRRHLSRVLPNRDRLSWLPLLRRGVNAFTLLTVPSTSRPGWARRATRNGRANSAQTPRALRLLTGIVAVSLVRGGVRWRLEAIRAPPAAGTPTDYSKRCDEVRTPGQDGVDLPRSSPLRTRPTKAPTRVRDCTGVTIAEYEGDRTSRRTSRSAPSPATCPASPSSRSRVRSIPWSTRAKPSRRNKTVSDEVDKYWCRLAQVRLWSTTSSTAAPFGANVKSYVYSRRSSRRRATRSRRPGPRLMDLTARSPPTTRRPKPWCAGFARARLPAGRAPTGSRMCSCVPRARTPTTSGSPTRSPSTTRRSSRRWPGRGHPQGPEVRQRRLR